MIALNILPQRRLFYVLRCLLYTEAYLPVFIIKTAHSGRGRTAKNI